MRIVRKIYYGFEKFFRGPKGDQSEKTPKMKKNNLFELKES